MQLSYSDKDHSSLFVITSQEEEFSQVLGRFSNLINIHWNQSEESIPILINHQKLELLPNQITTSTYNQELEFVDGFPTTFSFNREFYCIIDHDREVSCNGLIFFGTTEPPFITLDTIQRARFSTLMEVFRDEFGTRDNIQGEMLRVLLKRLIIKITRLVKEQNNLKDVPEDQLTVIRKFNVLVEIHFRKLHQVADYADLLFKSPKTISNYFNKHSRQTPLQVIQDRLILETKKMLYYSDKSIKEISQELGFKDPAVLSKIFKKSTGLSPSDFKENQAAA
ncbi:MAG: helix-turn-helix domain-containing protein [Cyclobacteriaceae bacterium]